MVFDAHLKTVLGATVLNTCNSIKLLVVGAGGIGCELLKDLVLSGFINITVVDLDTIDITNLNRQFLFRRQHVGHPKSTVASEAVKRFNANVNIDAHLGNIRTEEFGVNFFDKFDLVINALDNFKARQHVNRLCLAAKIPLIEGGSTGWDGQAQVIHGGSTECFECRPAPKNPTFPVCTIRSTPERPEHCVAWAKLVFDAIFSSTEEGADIAPGLDWASKARQSGDVTLHHQFAAAVSKQLFQTMMNERLKAIETSPDAMPSNGLKPLSISDDLIAKAQEVAHTALNSTKGAASLDSATEFADLFAPSARSMPRDDALALLHAAVVRILETVETAGESLTFSKDDSLSVDFVAAAANLRAFVFNIETHSRFKLHSIAGSIVPAIATTNAIVAGLQTFQLINLIKKFALLKCENPSLTMKSFDDVKSVTANCKTVWLVPSNPSGGRFALMPQQLDPPSQFCFVCADAQVRTRVKNLSDLTVKELVEALKQDLALCNPIIEFDGCIVYEHMTETDFEDEDEEDVYKQGLKKNLKDFNITNGSSLLVTDDSQGDVSIRLLISVDEGMKEMDNQSSNGKIAFDSAGAAATQQQQTDAAAAAASAMEGYNESSKVNTQEDGNNGCVKGIKRMLGVDEAEEAVLQARQDKKRGKINNEDSSHPISLNLEDD